MTEVPVIATLENTRGIAPCICEGWHLVERTIKDEPWRIVGHAMNNAEADEWMHIVR